MKLSLFLFYLGSIEGFAGLVSLYVLKRKKFPDSATGHLLDWPSEPPPGEELARRSRPPGISNFAYDLFLSYTNKDRAFVERLAADLRGRGFKLWWDQPEIGAGDSIVASIDEGLSKSRQFAVVLSPESRRAHWVAREISAALALESELMERGGEAQAPFLIPILYQVCDLPPLLKDRRRADFTHSYEKGLAELLRQLRPASSSRQSQPS